MVSGRLRISSRRTRSAGLGDLPSSWITKSLAVAALAGAVVCDFAGDGVASSDSPPPARPIIAELFSDVEGYHGQMVVVYGLVIAITDAGRAFILQDVSQMPLRVVVTDGATVRLGDQVLVEGVAALSDGEVFLKSTRIVPTKVLGGGGCC